MLWLPHMTTSWLSCTVANFIREEGMTGKLPIVLRYGTSATEALYPRETSCKYTNVVTGVLDYFEKKEALKADHGETACGAPSAARPSLRLQCTQA